MNTEEKAKELLQNFYSKISGMPLDFVYKLVQMPNEDSYKPSYDEGEPDIEIVHVTLKNGYGALVYLSVSEFEKLLNEHSK